MSKQEHVIRDTNTKQHIIQRKNLLSVSRLCIQTICDESGTLGVIDDNSENLVNLCNIIESLLCHGFSKLNTNKRLQGTPDGILYWEFIVQACKSVPYSCIDKIRDLIDVRTTRGKGRAWIRMALMEKRLSEYFSVALMEDTIIRRYYERGGFMSNEEAHIFTNVASALNSVDFSLCLRNTSFDLPVVYTIDYSSYLKYPVSDRQLDMEETLLRLERNRLQNDASSTCSGGHARSESTISERELTSEEEVAKLKRSIKLVVDQKAYLEEILNLKDMKCTELTQQLLEWDEQVEKEKKLSDSIIMELQQQLNDMHLQYRQMQDKLTDVQTNIPHDEMEPVQARSRYSITLQRPTEGVDIVAEMERNGYCSRSSSDQSVKRSTDSLKQRRSESVRGSSDSIRRSTDTLLTQTTSSQSGGGPSNRDRNMTVTRPRNYSTTQKLAGMVEDILPDEKERLMFHVHKKLQQESFISFGDPADS